MTTEIERTAFPPELRGLIRLLNQLAAEVDEKLYSSPFDQRWVFRVGPARVRMGADRGIWFVELSHRSADEYFDSQTWLSVLAGAPPSLELVPLAEQAGVIETLVLVADNLSASTVELTRASHEAALGRQRRMAAESTASTKAGNCAVTKSPGPQPRRAT